MAAGGIRLRRSPVDVVIVGPFPPPFGGISVHVRRLSRLAAEHGLSVTVFNHFRTTQADPLIARDLFRNPFRYWVSLRSVRARVVHYHHSRWSTLLATAVAVTARRNHPATIITVHGHELDSIVRRRSPGGALTRWALRRFDAVIAVSDGVAEPLMRAVPDLAVSVVPAYLAPGNEPQSDLSDGMRAFLGAGRPTLLVAAYRLNNDSRGQSIYGVDFAFELFSALAPRHPGLRLAIFLAKPDATPAERRRAHRLLEHAAARGFAERFRIALAEPLAPALAFDSVVLRPSRTDGDAVTVREAIAAGRPVVVSNVVDRPDGVESLPLDQAAWCATISKLLSDPPPVRPKPPTNGHGTNVLAIYKALLPR